MKFKFNSIDLAVIAAEFRQILIPNYRLINFYDMENKNFLMKFSGENEKKFIYIKNGDAIYLTCNPPDTRRKFPTTFCSKIRSCLNNKRISEIKQIEFDRILILTFGIGEFQNHLIIELFAGGNIVLTDNEYKILTLIRWHDYNEENKVRVGHIYPFDVCGNQFDSNSNQLFSWIKNELPNIDKKISIKNFLVNNKSPLTAIGSTIVSESIYLCFKQLLDYKIQISLNGSENVTNVTNVTDVTKNLDSINRCAYEKILEIFKNINQDFVTNVTNVTDVTKNIFL